MKKIKTFWSNWKLRKICKQFKYGDYIYIEDSTDFYGPNKQVYRIEELINNGWFSPLLLAVKYWNVGATLFYPLNTLKKFIVFSSIKPQFEVGQLITIDQEVFTVETYVPYVEVNQYLDLTKFYSLTFKYNCQSVENSNKMINAFECDLFNLISKSKIWNDLNAI